VTGPHGRRAVPEGVVRPRTSPGTFMLSSGLLFLAFVLVIMGTLEDGGAQTALLLGAMVVYIGERLVFMFARERSASPEPRDDGPWPGCPYCPPYRRGSLWYPQPAAVRGKGGAWAWCGRCGALSHRSTGGWERPQPEQWDTTFRDEAPPG